MKSIEIDRKKRLRDEPHKGHNRWHPDIPPVIEVEPGEEVVLETRDANDLQISTATTAIQSVRSSSGTKNGSALASSARRSLSFRLRPRTNTTAVGWSSVRTASCTLR